MLWVKGSFDSVEYRKAKKKEYKQKKQAVLKNNEKYHTIQGDYSKIYTKITYNAIKMYLVYGQYLYEISSVTLYEARRQRKCGLRQIIDQGKIYK